MPFGVGRNVCLGEKLAIAELFLVFTRFIQKTIQYDITLHSHDGIDPDPNDPNSVLPKKFQIMIKSK